jgi:hypothetical protein
MNGGKAGELIDVDPESLCGSDCVPQTSSSKLSSRSIIHQNDDSWKLNHMKNKGVSVAPSHDILLPYEFANNNHSLS